MSITGLVMTYENNHYSNIFSSKLTPTLLEYTPNYMDKMGPSLNSRTLKPASGVIHKQQQSYESCKEPHLQKTYMNAKRKHSEHNRTGQLYHDKNNYLHLNSLWSIWYGVLLTLYQGYLAIHGASRFLGCSLLSWKIEPVAELNSQIVLSGLVFVLLPFFFTSAVFKVGNMANDGVKLASALKDRLCSKVVNDDFEGELYTGPIKKLWMHGGPTAAFIHILIAICLLLPRLLLEGRIIENGLLPREAIWRTELDFMAVKCNNLVDLHLKSSHYQNNTFIESMENDNDFNDTMFFIETYSHKNDTNMLDSNYRRKNSNILVEKAKKNYIEFSDLTKTAIVQNYTKEERYSEKFKGPSTFTTPFSVEGKAIGTNNEDLKENAKAIIYEDIQLTTIPNVFSNSTQKIKQIAKNENKLFSFPSHHVSHNTYHNKQQNRLNNHNGKKIQKSNRQRKPHQLFHPYEKNDRFKNQNNIKFDFLDIGYLNHINLSNKSQNNNDNKVYEVLNFSQKKVPIISKFSTETSMTVRDSNMHIVKPEILSQIIPSTAISRNSKIIAIKRKMKRSILPKKENDVDFEPEMFVNGSSEYIAEIDSVESSTISIIQSTPPDYNVIQLDGFAGILQHFFGVKKPIDVNTFNNPPSAEFVNLLFALLVWCVRYPAVFWTTAKSFATIFSIQMIASAADIIFSYVGISILFKLQIYSQEQPIQNQGLVLNASVTLALFLLSVILILCSSMVLYLFGFGRLSSKMCDRARITLSSNKSWIYFAHCSSLCYILALCVVKAPLLNDLNATYRNSFHCSTFVAALISVMHIISWVLMWIVLGVKSKWSFKLPPLDTYTIIEKASTQPLLTHKKRRLKNTTAAVLNKSTGLGLNSTVASENAETKLKHGKLGKFPSNTSSSDVLNGTPSEETYWPKATPTSLKLKVTFNEVTSTSDDSHHRLFDANKHNDGKRNSTTGASVYFTSLKGEVDDGEYATLRSDPKTVVGNTSDDSYLSEYQDLPPPPNMTSMAITNHTTTASVNSKNSYINSFADYAVNVLSNDGITDEGKLLERVLPDSVTYASATDLDPLTLCKTKNPSDYNATLILKEKYYSINECTQLSSALEYLISPLASVKPILHTNKSHISHSLTPRSDTNSFGTECTISPPERAPSESSSGIHSGEDREIEVIIRPRVTQKHLSKWMPPAIQEEPNVRCTNMRMSTFAAGINLNSATLPPPRLCTDEKFNYSQHCSTMPLPTNNNKHQDQQTETVYATSAHCMSKTQNTSSNVSSFKAPLYVNSEFALPDHKQHFHRTTISPQQHLTHTILSNGVRYSNPNVFRRQPFLKSTDPQSSLAKSTIHEDRDSANFSMISDQESIYATTNSY